MKTDYLNMGNPAHLGSTYPPQLVEEDLVAIAIDDKVRMYPWWLIDFIKIFYSDIYYSLSDNKLEPKKIKNSLNKSINKERVWPYLITTVC